MPNIVGIFGRRPDAAPARVLRRMVGAPDASSGPSRQGRGGVDAKDAALAERAGVTVAADANLSYREDLFDGLRSAGAGAGRWELPGAESTDADLILQAYLTWGEECATKLEGDFAFVIWDEERAEGFAAVDFAAGRTLFYAPLDGSLALASSLSSVTSHPAVGRDLNLPHVGEIAAGMWAGTDETCFSGVRRLLPGHSLRWTKENGLRVWRHWRLPHRSSGRSTLAEGADVLRELLIRATGERLSRRGSTAVWMSGGWDSTAVFAAGQEWLRREGADRERLRPVSMSYPEGDPGREDAWIGEVSERWNVEPFWVDSAEVPVLDRVWEHARERDDIWAHPLEHWNRALAGATREMGASVTLTGNGGDQLFAGPVGQFSDLFWTGRWTALRREWVERKGRGARTFLRAAVLPGAPRPAYELARLLRGGRRLHHYLDRRPPSWIRDSFVHDQRLMDRQWDERRWWRPGGAARGEMEFYFGTAYAPRVSATVRGFALDEGSELASPLLDRRVVEFAAVRPAEERSKGLESKRLLREAMRGLVPDSVLAPRPRKTGLTVAFFDRGLRAAIGPLTEDLSDRMILVELGIVDATALRSAAESYARSSGPSPLGLGLYLTLQAELWLRTHVRERVEDRVPARGTEPARPGMAVVWRG